MGLTHGQVKANHARVHAEADAITQRLLTTNVTIQQLCKEYRVGNWLISKVYTERATPKQREAARLRKLDAQPSPGRFSAGHRTWNLGNKGFKPKGSEKGHFKKGCMRGNAARRYAPVDSVHLRKQGGRLEKYVKVRDDGPSGKRWIPLAHHLWIKAHGPIPHGFVVAYRDGDSQNVVMSNLELVNRGVILNRNLAKPETRKRRSTSIWKKRRERTEVEGFRRERDRHFVEVMECAGCGEVAGDVSVRCPKCGSLRFVKGRKAA